mmetsp:Transcript_30762/g.73913  ORF Transcript_30762/g.73913 Transcript_30762/m.73913 type:complete len:326 (+) Transcript_30762:592-1569(+)
MRRRHRLCDRDAEEVEEGNRGHVPEHCREQQLVAEHLSESVEGVFDAGAAVADVIAAGDVVHGDEGDGEVEEPEGAFQTHSVEAGDALVAREDELLRDHLHCNHHLCSDDEDVAEEGVRGFWLRGLPVILQRTDTDDGGAGGDKKHADPVEGEEGAAEDDNRQHPREHNHAPPQHLEDGGVGHGEAKVHDAGASHVEEGRPREHILGEVKVLVGVWRAEEEHCLEHKEAQHLTQEHTRCLGEGVVEGRAARRAELIRVGGVGDGRAGFCGIVESIVWYALHIRVFCRDRVDAAGDEHPESQDELCGSHPCVGLSLESADRSESLV